MFVAQDMNMTNGDYAFFTFGSVPFPGVSTPWFFFQQLDGAAAGTPQKSAICRQTGACCYYISRFGTG
jgi:hypothetical protein